MSVNADVTAESDVPPLARSRATSLRDARITPRQRGALRDEQPAGARKTDEANQIRSLTQLCEEAIAVAVGAPTRTTVIDLSQICHTTQSLARRGCSVVAINRAIRIAFDTATEHLAQRSAHASANDIATDVRRLVDIHEAVAGSVSSAIVDAIHGSASNDVRDHPDGRKTRSPRAIFASNRGSAPDLELPASPTASHVVLAIAIPPHLDEQDPAQDRKLAGQRKLQRVQSALRERLATAARVTLSPRGGTIVLPVGAAAEDSLDDLVSQLSWAAEVPVTAIALTGSHAWIRRLSNLAHELLNVAQGLRFDGGVYRFADLALEYQLTRPTQAYDALARALDPLDGHPELLHTLTLHIHTNMSRRVTARLLNLHRNTIDYRLHRIEELTGYDPATASGMWYLSCAMVVRAYRKTADGGATIGLGITA